MRHGRSLLGLGLVLAVVALTATGEEPAPLQTQLDGLKEQVGTLESRKEVILRREVENYLERQAAFRAAEA